MGLNSKYRLKEKYYLFGIIGLIIIFLSKFISFTKLLINCSILKIGDLSDHIPEIYFLAKYGYLNIVPDWYNGFRLFEAYPPGWSFFVYPFYYLFNNLEAAVYIACILLYAIGFSAIFILGKRVGLSALKRIAFFVFLFMNPIMIDYFIIGRFAEIFAFTISVIIFFLIMIYKDKKLNMYSLFLIVPYSIVLISHPYVAPLTSILFFSLFLIKPKKQRLFIISIIVASILLSLIWLGPFLDNLINYSPEKESLTVYQKGELLSWKSFFSFNTVSLLLFWFVLHIYSKNKIFTKKEKIFFLPMIILSMLIFFRISPFLPILNHIPPNTYNLFFLMIGLFLFLKIKSYSNKALRNIILIGLIILPFLCASHSLVFRGPLSSTCNELEQEIISFFPEIDDKYLMVTERGTQNWLISYATIYFDLSTPSGEGDRKWGSVEMYKSLIKLDNSIKEKDCQGIKGFTENFEVKYLISYGEKCELLSECDFKLYKQKNEACLFS